MKRLDLLATLVVVAMVFVALVFSLSSPRPKVPAPASVVAQVESPPRPLSLAKTLLKTTIDGDFTGFKNECKKEGDAQMKLVVTQPSAKDMFLKASASIGPLCQNGYELEYLTAMNQQGSEVYLWKLIPKLGQSQFLVRLTLNGGKIAGFFFQ
jgi:hypothetical protein